MILLVSPYFWRFLAKSHPCLGHGSAAFWWGEKLDFRKQRWEALDKSNCGTQQEEIKIDIDSIADHWSIFDLKVS